MTKISTLTFPNFGDSLRNIKLRGAALNKSINLEVFQFTLEEVPAFQ